MQEPIFITHNIIIYILKRKYFLKSICISLNNTIIYLGICFAVHISSLITNAIYCEFMESYTNISCRHTK